MLQERKKILAINSLSKKIATKDILDDINLTIHAGEIVGIVGPNGAGKTTLLLSILGLVLPTNGSIKLFDLELPPQNSSARYRLNFAASNIMLSGNLTVLQNLKMFGLLYSVPNLNTRISILLNELEITKKDVLTGTLSSGEHMRVLLAKALINSPELLLLDEPTASLDPISAKFLRKYIVNHARQHNCGILWTSHNIEEIEKVSDRVVFLIEGKLLAIGEPQSLLYYYAKTSLSEIFISINETPKL